MFTNLDKILYYRLRWTSGVNQNSLHSFQASIIYCFLYWEINFFCYTCCKTDWPKLLKQKVPHIYYDKVFLWPKAYTYEKSGSKYNSPEHVFLYETGLFVFARVCVICCHLDTHSPWLNPKGHGNQAWSNLASLLTLIFSEENVFLPHSLPHTIPLLELAGILSSSMDLFFNSSGKSVL